MVRALGYAWSAPLGLVGLLVALVAMVGGGRAGWRSGALVVVCDGALSHAMRSRGWGGLTVGWTIVLWHDHPLVEAHERVHVHQAFAWGPLLWPAYLLCLVACGYRENPFEVHARRVAGH